MDTPGAVAYRPGFLEESFEGSEGPRVWHCTMVARLSGGPAGVIIDI